MKKIKYFLISSIITFIALNACKKIDHSNEVPLVVTGDTSNVQLTSVTITGTVTPNDAPIQTSGHIWSSINQLPTYSNSEGRTTINGLLPRNQIISKLANLSPGKTYYVRGYVISGVDTIYGNLVNFLTPGYQAATITTDTASNITFSSANVAATVTSIGNTQITQHGHVWSSTNNTPTIADSITSLGPLSGPTTYTSSLSNLSAGTVYYVRAYIVNSSGTVYGNVVTFTTLSNFLLSVTTNTVSSISVNSATAGGSITNIGSTPVSQYGHVWSSTNNLPTVNDNKTQLGAANAPANFNSQITGLSAGTTYYVRAYAINNNGISYGAVVTFITSTPGNNLPLVTTGNISSVTFSTATAAGNITDVGSSAVTQYGHVWSSTNNIPTVNDSKTQLGSANAATGFNSSLTGLVAGTTYYVRAYAINSSGTSYGAVVTFTTSSANNLPVVYIPNVYNVFVNYATSDGTITDNGGSPITQYGHVWSSTNNLPTVNDNKTQLGTSNFVPPISFTSYLSGLAANTTYYIRAYATNSSGTAYSSTVLKFTTYPAQRAPSVTTGSISSLTSNSVNVAGNLTDVGYPSVLRYGHGWVNTNTQAAFESDLGGTNTPISYTSSLTGLDPGTLYYVYAYARNGIEGRGAVIGFTTLVGFVSNTVNTITTTTAKASAGFKNDGRSQISQYGHVWSSTNNVPTITSNDNKTINPYQFISSLTGLTPNTTYYVRAYAINDGGTSYSTVTTFTTTTANTLADVTTGDPYYQPPGVANAVVVFPGTINNTGNTPITQHGHVWSKTNTTPTLSDSFNQLGAATTGTYNSVFSPNVITPGTYYVRAYVTNSAGTSYGAVKTFKY